MAKRVHPDQIAFTFPEPVHSWVKPAEPVTAPRRSLVDRLVEAGVLHTASEAQDNGCLTVPIEHRHVSPWSLPSRLYTFGIRIAAHYEGPERLRSQRLVVGIESMLEHPYVEVLRELGFEVGVGFEASQHLSNWHHAVDLMTDEHWEDLLLTRRHTYPEYISNAVSYALQYRGLRTCNARSVMAEMGWREPKGRSADRLRGDGLQPMRADGGIAPNRMLSGPDGAWMMIHGLEDGWMKKGRHGHAWMTPEGMARRSSQAVAA